MYCSSSQYYPIFKQNVLKFFALVQTYLIHQSTVITVGQCCLSLGVFFFFFIYLNKYTHKDVNIRCSHEAKGNSSSL